MEYLMSARIAINGFGRIGRLVLRSLFEMKKKSNLEIVAINASGSLEGCAMLLQRDSIHGEFTHKVEVNKNCLRINSENIQYISDRDPSNLPWESLDIDIVLECTGKFTTHDAASQHIDSGAKKVLVSAPVKNADKTIVYGVNHQQLTSEDRIVSNSSCTTNCLAPLAYVLNKNVGIQKGFMTTVHAYTSDQRSLDNNHSDPRRARSCHTSIVPTSTGAAKSLSLIIPELSGKLDGTAVRVPIPNVSMVDMTFLSEQPTTIEDINLSVKTAAETTLKGILGYNNLPLVSIDFNHDSHSSYFDSTQTQVIGENFVRVLSWYDNEWGFSNRMVDTAIAMTLAN